MQEELVSAIMTENEARLLYLDNVKRCVTDSVYQHPEIIPVTPQGMVRRLVVRLLARRGLEIVRRRSIDAELKREGKIWPKVAHTMIGEKRLDNIQFCVEDVIKSGVPGDLIETGVWRGGASIFMRAILKAYGCVDRKVWVADSFAGLPPPDADQYPADEGDVLYRYTELAISINQVRMNFERYGLLDEQVVFLKGWFRDTLPAAPIDRLAVMRLDGDMYESTMVALKSLYQKLSVGGYVIVDDYGCFPACAKAVTDFRLENGITDELMTIDWSGVYWKKSG